ncbi:MAG TPA: M48 family metallopeptidase [Pyrinomonadaceae bacterium]|nr:M48 family metallopeptidase [Pyrinomonadaceae bacterium]
MRGIPLVKRFSAGFFAVALLATTLAAQTRVVAPKNKYKTTDDVQLGNKAANEVERQFPLINDSDAQAYLSRIGDRLVAAIPPELQHNEFNYRFKWVNASDLNAFALPGGPMYVNRGMLESAHNEGELAGVMAHELSHVALRHATAQATKNSSAGSTLRNLGLILGGAVLGGQAGAELGAVAAQGFALKYSREYETQADTLGAQMMARAGYDPQDLANVFRTIQSQGGSSGPTWMSSHPDPGNRYQKISQEAQYLRVQNPIKVTRDFSRIQERFRAMPRARSMAEIEKGRPAGDSNGGYEPSANGRYSSDVPYPSTRMRTYNEGNILSISIPDNWQEMGGNSAVEFAPEGAYGSNGITRGVMLGVESGSGGLSQATQNYIDGLLQSNSYLRSNGYASRTTLGGRQAYVTTLSGQSPVTRRTEVVTIYTTQMRNGQ